MRTWLIAWISCLAAALLYFSSSRGEPAGLERPARIVDLGGEAAGLRLVVSPGGEPQLPADLLPRSAVYALMPPGAERVTTLRISVPVREEPAELYVAGKTGAWARVPSHAVMGELHADVERFSYIVAAAPRPMVWREVTTPPGGLTSFAFIGSRIFAAGEGGVWSSQDAGETWQGWSDGLPDSVKAVSVLGNSVFAVSHAGTFVRQIGEPKWRPWPSGVIDQNARPSSFAVAGQRLFSAVDRDGTLAVRFSDDAGRTWHDFSGGLPLTCNGRPIVLATDGSVLLASVCSRTFKAKAL